MAADLRFIGLSKAILRPYKPYTLVETCQYDKLSYSDCDLRLFIRFLCACYEKRRKTKGFLYCCITCIRCGGFDRNIKYPDRPLGIAASRAFQQLKAIVPEAPAARDSGWALEASLNNSYL